MRRPAVVVWREIVCASESLRARARYVALRLAMFLPSDGIGFVYPAVSTLSAGMGVSEPTVRKGLRELEAAGYLTISWSRGGSTHRYWMRLPDDGVPDELRAEYEATTRKNLDATRKKGRKTPNALSGNRATAKQGARSAGSERATDQVSVALEVSDDLAGDDRGLADPHSILGQLYGQQSPVQPHEAGLCDDCGADRSSRVRYGRAVLCSGCWLSRIRASERCAE